MAGKRSGPQIFVSYFRLDGPSPLFPGASFLLTNTGLSSARNKVREIVASGYDMVKVATALPLSDFDAIMKAAKEENIIVGGHLPMSVGFEYGLKKGLRSVEHLTGYDVACAESEIDLKPIVEDFHQGFAYCTSEKIREIVMITANYQTWNVPTLILFEKKNLKYQQYRISGGKTYQPPLALARNRYKSLSKFANPRARAAIQGTRVVRFALVKALNDAGAPLLVGTDMPGAGYDVHQELALLVEAGLSPYQALTAATSEPARFFRKEGEFGTITAGAQADLVLLDANPLISITNTEKIRGVMVQGRWMSRADIDQELDRLAKEYEEDTAL